MLNPTAEDQATTWNQPPKYFFFFFGVVGWDDLSKHNILDVKFYSQYPNHHDNSKNIKASQKNYSIRWINVNRKS